MRWTARSPSLALRSGLAHAGWRSALELALVLVTSIPVTSILVASILVTSLLAMPTLARAAPSTTPAIAPRTADALDRVVELVLASPLDETRLASALDFAEEQRAVSTLLERLTARAIDGNAHYAVGRIAELSGSPVRAFDAYHRAANATSPSPRARGRLALLYWRADARERARAIAQEGWELPEADRERLDLLLAPTDEARARLVELAATRPEFALEVARERGDVALRLAVADVLDRVSERLAALLDAGELDRAEETWRKKGNAEIPVELVYRLARALGDRTLLVERVGTATSNPRGTKLLESLDRSLGSVPGDGSASPGPGTSPTDRPDDPSTTPHPNDQADPNDRNDRNDPNRDGVEPTGPTAPLPNRDDPEARAALRRSLVAERDAAPSLRRVIGWIRLGDSDEAQREWVRWKLDPDPVDEARWLPILLREPDAHFVHPNAPLRVLEEARKRTEASPEFSERLLLALDRVAPGTALEARLLFHRGRLLNRREDRERARRIAPSVTVEYRLQASSELTATLTLAHGVESLRDRFDSIDLPSPIDAPFGFDAIGPARLAVLPVPPTEPSPIARLIADLAPLTLGDWRETPRPLGTPRPDGDDRLRLPRVDSDDTASMVELDVSGIRPWVGVLSLPSPAYLAWGHGLAIFDSEGQKIWQVQRPAPLAIGALPDPIVRALPAGWASFLAATDPRASELARALEHPSLARFLDDVRARRDDPSVTLRSVLPDGDDWLVHTSDGVRARFRRGETPPVSRAPRRPPHADRATYTLTASTPPATPAPAGGVAHFWRRTDEPVAPPPEPDPSSPSSVFVRLERTEGPEPTIEFPEPRAPAARPAGSDHLRSRVFTAQWGSRRVEVTDDGWVLGFVGDGPAHWALEIPTPLEGERGFLPRGERAVRAPLDLPRDRVLAGPASRRGVPRVTWDGGPLLVHTDHVWTIHDPWTSHASSTGVAVDPGPLALTGPLPGLRDVAVGTGGLAWLAGDTLHAAHGSSVVVPGAFDLACLPDPERADVHFVLAQRYDLHLARIDADGRRTELPLPDGIVFENDRLHLRMSALGVWRSPDGDRLLFQHGDLYALQPDETWERLVTWDEGTRPYFYWQRPPTIVDGRLFVVRPDGAWETWQAPTR